MNLFYSAHYQTWKGVYLWGTLSLACLFGIITLGPMTMTAITLPLMVVSIIGIIGFGLLLSISVYTVLALEHAEKYKNNGSEPDFHKEAARLRRLRDKYAREMLTYKGYPSTHSSAYRNLIETERALAAHLEEPYVEPSRTPSRY